VKVREVPAPGSPKAGRRRCWPRSVGARQGGPFAPWGELHGVCSRNVYIKDGIITWETQQTDYPSVGPDMPEYEPRGYPRTASFS
jgi:hypothetical protein